jgi:hypothetical protein
MSLNATAAYGIFPNNVALNEVTQTLNHGGFDKESICMMLPPTHPIAVTVRDAGLRVSEREANAATAGLIGWLSEFGAVVIPSVGFFIRSQVFLRALITGRDSVGPCSHSNTLVGLGFQEHDAERFADHLDAIGALVYVSCPEPARMRWAVELLRGTGADETGTLENDREMVAADA